MFETSIDFTAVSAPIDFGEFSNVVFGDCLNLAQLIFRYMSISTGVLGANKASSFWRSVQNFTVVPQVKSDWGGMLEIDGRNDRISHSPMLFGDIVRHHESVWVVPDCIGYSDVGENVNFFCYKDNCE